MTTANPRLHLDPALGHDLKLRQRWSAGRSCRHIVCLRDQPMSLAHRKNCHQAVGRREDMKLIVRQLPPDVEVREQRNSAAASSRQIRCPIRGGLRCGHHRSQPYRHSSQPLVRHQFFDSRTWTLLLSCLNSNSSTPRSTRTPARASASVKMRSVSVCSSRRR